MISPEKNFNLELSPYLSFCVQSRNDNHGGNMYRRMRTCLMGFFEQAERHQLRSEIVLVDWNPPANKPILKDAYQWPRHSQFCTIRVIVVPPSIHQRYPDWQRIPVNNCVAQNVAVRRARGKFILPSTVDVLFSDHLMQFLASGELQEDKIYQIDRTDVNRKVTRLHSLDEQLDYCAKNVLRIHRFQSQNPHRLVDGILESWNPLPGLEEFPAFYTAGPGDFTLMARNRWHELHGFPETDLLGGGMDILLAYMACVSGAKAESLADKGSLYHIDHNLRFHSPEANWLARFGLRDILPKAVLDNLRSVVRRFFPARTELEKVGIQTMTWAEMADLISQMARKERSVAYNGENWGLGNETFEEFVVTAAEMNEAVANV